MALSDPSILASVLTFALAMPWQRPLQRSDRHGGHPRESTPMPEPRTPWHAAASASSASTSTGVGASGRVGANSNRFAHLAALGTSRAWHGCGRMALAHLIAGPTSPWALARRLLEAHPDDDDDGEGEAGNDGGVHAGGKGDGAASAARVEALSRSTRSESRSRRLAHSSRACALRGPHVKVASRLQAQAAALRQVSSAMAADSFAMRSALWRFRPASAASVAGNTGAVEARRTADASDAAAAAAASINCRRGCAARTLLSLPAAGVLVGGWLADPAVATAMLEAAAPASALAPALAPTLATGLATGLPPGPPAYGASGATGSRRDRVAHQSSNSNSGGGGLAPLSTFGFGGGGGGGSGSGGAAVATVRVALGALSSMATLEPLLATFHLMEPFALVEMPVVLGRAPRVHTRLRACAQRKHPTWTCTASTCQPRGCKCQCCLWVCAPCFHVYMPPTGPVPRGALRDRYGLGLGLPAPPPRRRRGAEARPAAPGQACGESVMPSPAEITLLLPAEMPCCFSAVCLVLCSCALYFSSRSEEFSRRLIPAPSRARFRARRRNLEACTSRRRRT